MIVLRDSIQVNNKTMDEVKIIISGLRMYSTIPVTVKHFILTFQYC